MRKFSLVLAAVVMAVGLAESGSASAKDGVHEILSEGEILMKTSKKGSESTVHDFTVAHDGEIYRCFTYLYDAQGYLGCYRMKGGFKDLN